jgi:hypothetical protein
MARARVPRWKHESKIKPMRRESSTVVVLVGEADDGLLADLGRSPNVSVARVPAAEKDGRGQHDGARPGWEIGALAMREAARGRSTYVIVPHDPLAEVADTWRAMWGGPGGPAAAAGFEERAADALDAWRHNRFELPDYYLVLAPAQPDGTGPDLYLGPLRAVRPRRVAVAALTDTPAQPGQVIDVLRSLEHGPWWPPLDELLDAARRFYPGALAVTSSAPLSDVPEGRLGGRPA